MPRLKMQISMSLDGFIAGPDQSEDDPLGKGGEQLHDWVIALETWRRAHGREGGETTASSAVLDAWLETIGATVMGRNMFGGHGPWGDRSWDGWWGEDPPFGHPVFVVTHHPREPLVMQGGTTFHFVTEGIGHALEQAFAAAGGKDVALGGGASVAQQYMRAGLLDELLINVVPVLLGGGEPLFGGLGDAPTQLECTEVVGAPGVAHLRYRLR